MRNFIKYSTLVLAALCFASASYAQVSGARRATTTAKFPEVSGIVYDANTKELIPVAQISSPAAISSVSSNERGQFTITVRSTQTVLSISKDGYYTANVEVFGRSGSDTISVFLQRMDMTRLPDSYFNNEGQFAMSNKTGTATAVNIRDIGESYSRSSDALVGVFPSLRVINKSGMNGEGSFINMRGIRSFIGQNTPALVVDGVPYRPNQNLSNVINGFSADIMDPINLRDVSSITLLKGADALEYGSLGSNGVLVVTTDEGLANETRVEVRTTQGVGFISRQIPMMNDVEFRDYIMDIGSKYIPQNTLLTTFPFLKDPATYTEEERLKYGYNTNWQDELYRPAFVSDNSLKVKGGDAIVRYMLTAGYQSMNGVIEPSVMNKFYTRTNTNISFSPKLTANASIAFDYADMQLYEQGMTRETNPMLAAYGFSPSSTAYQYDEFNRRTDTYTEYDPAMLISNPVAMRSETENTARRYDMLINTGVKYQFLPNLQMDLKFGIYYNYMKEDMFAGGRTSLAIAPIVGGLSKALNTVRSGATETQNYYGRVGFKYNTTFKEKHNLNLALGWQMMSAKETASNGMGYNTTSDKIRNLNSVTDVSRQVDGYNELWNWMNGYLTASYNYDYQIYASATAMVDAASTYGSYSSRAFVLPAFKVGWKIDNAPFMRNSNVVDNLMLRAEYSVNPNSRYDSRYSTYYYVLKKVRDISGLVRAGVPNLKIEPEKVHNINVGLDFATIGHKFTASVDLYQENTKDMIVESKISSSYGASTMFKNDGELRTRGIEVGASALIFGQGNFKWMAGTNIGAFNTVIRSLGGGLKEQVLELTDGVSVINRVGESPYAFYGYVSQGVFQDEKHVAKYDYRTQGGYYFQAGDVIFKDRDGDKMITSHDREILGDATPDFYGNIFSKMSLKNFTLSMNWSFSYGNDIYNGVRRLNESGTTFSNQAASMTRRWQQAGQVTDIPRVTYIDNGQNNRFSSRWIEDGSYIKLKELTLSYDFGRKVLFMNDLKVFITAENLLTFTKYSGSDPEFSYSYDMDLQGMDLAKIPVPKYVKLGLIMNF